MASLRMLVARELWVTAMRGAELTTTTVSFGPAGVSTISTLSCTPRARSTFVTRVGANPVSHMFALFEWIEGLRKGRKQGSLRRNVGDFTNGNGDGIGFALGNLFAWGLLLCCLGLN